MKVQVCTGKSCTDRFSPYIESRLQNDKKMYNFETLMIENCPCQWRCKEGPVVVFDGKIEVHMNGIKASKMLVDKLKKKLNPAKRERKPSENPDGDIGYLEHMYIWK